MELYRSRDNTQGQSAANNQLSSLSQGFSLSPFSSEEQLPRIQNLTGRTPSLTHVPNMNILVLLYAQDGQPKDDKPEEASKKKNPFAKATPAPTCEPLWIFSLSQLKWRTQNAKGKLPPKRTHHFVANLDDGLILYGGKSVTDPSKTFNDTYAINLTTLNWRKLFVMEPPPSSADCTFSRLDSVRCLLLSSGQLWLFSTKDVKWELSSLELPGATWTQIVPSSPFPERIISLTALSETQIVILTPGTKLMSLDLKTKQLTYLAKHQSCLDFREQEQASLLRTDQNSVLLLGSQVNLITFNSDSTFKATKKGAGYNHPQLSTTHCISDQYIEVYSLSREGQLTRRYYEKRTRIEVQETPMTSRRVEQTYSASIAQESHEESAQLYRDSEAPDQQSSRIIRREETVNVENNDPDNHSNLKQKFVQLIALEHLKRRILESKAKMLERAIRNSEAMVLALYRFGGQSEKMAHIEEVRSMKQALAAIYSRQAYFRHQINSRDPSSEKICQQALKADTDGDLMEVDELFEQYCGDVIGNDGEINY